jgi:GTP-binding protein Era
MRSGFVSIIGRPNVGKSTLLNSIIDAKLAITSNVAGTTRNAIEGIYNDDETQIIFIDTPGINKPLSKLGRVLNKEATSAMENVDVALFLVDASTPIGKNDRYIIRRLSNNDIPVILVLNKVDKITKETLIHRINEYKDEYSFSDIVPISALKEENINELIKVIKTYLKDNIVYYEKTQVTNLDPKFMISELVREKILRMTNDEVPHSVTCVTTHLENKEDIVEAYVDIIVDRDSLKKIIIGKGGNMLKEIGRKARVDIQSMYDKKVYLELYVKTIKDWKDKEIYLRELGFYKDEY